MVNARTKISRLVISIVVMCSFAVAVIGHPGSGIHVDRLGQVFFLDTGSGLWKIDSKGSVTHLSPLRNHWLAMDPDNRFIQSRVPTDPAHDWVITSAGSNPTMLISTDFPIVIGEDGNLYRPTVRERSLRILKVGFDGRSNALAELPRLVSGGTPEFINGIAKGPAGSIYYTENDAVRRITADGRVTTIATVTPLANGPSIPDVDTHPYLRGLKVDSNGVVYVADSGDARVLKITPEGKVTSLVQLESPWAPTDVAIAGDVVYVLEFLHTVGDNRVEWMPRVRKITPDGKSSIIITVDKMPGARPGKSNSTSTSYSYFSIEFLSLLLRTIL